MNGRYAQFGLILALALLFEGCAAPSALPPEALATATSEAALLAVYEELLARGGDEAPADSEVALQLQEAGARLARMRADSIRAEIAAARTGRGLIPEPVLARYLPLPEQFRRWSPSVYAALRDDLEAERGRTLREVSALQDALRAESDEGFSRQLEVLERLAELAADGARYGARREALVERLLREARAGLVEGDIELASSRIDALLQEMPDATEVRRLARDLDDLIDRRRFVEAVEGGALQAAVEIHEELVAGGAASAFAVDLEPVVRELWNQLAGRFGSALRAGDLGAAYDDFRGLMLVQASSGLVLAPVDADRDRFADEVYRRSRAALDAGRPGRALGLLFVVDEVRGDFPGLAELKNEARGKVAARALPRLGISTFGSTAQYEQAGGAVSAEVTQYLFNEARDDIRLVERERLEEVLREKELQSLSAVTGEGFSLQAADYLLQGTVLEARIDSSVRTGQRRERAVVGYRTAPNPDYAAWQAKRESERPDRSPPPETLDVPVEEDVTYEVGIHRKYGLVNVSYRVIDVGSASIAHTDTVSVDEERVDQSSQGVSIGEFEVPFSMPELPSDGRLMTALLREVADLIGQRLVELFDDPVGQYEREAMERAQGQDFDSAVAAAANAYVLADREGAFTAGIGDLLKRYALRG